MDYEEGQRQQQKSPSDLFSSAKVVAEAAKETFGGESGGMDKGRVAGAASDLLDAASQYGNLGEKGIGGYVKKAETYLDQYESSNSSQRKSEGEYGGKGKSEGGGYGDYEKSEGGGYGGREKSEGGYGGQGRSEGGYGGREKSEAGGYGDYEKSGGEYGGQGRSEGVYGDQRKSEGGGYGDYEKSEGGYGGQRKSEGGYRD